MHPVNVRVSSTEDVSAMAPPKEAVFRAKIAVLTWSWPGDDIDIAPPLLSATLPVNDVVPEILTTELSKEYTAPVPRRKNKGHMMSCRYSANPSSSKNV